MFQHSRRRGGFSLPGLIVLAVLALGLLALMIARFSASKRSNAVEVSAYLAPTPAVSAAAKPEPLCLPYTVDMSTPGAAISGLGMPFWANPRPDSI